MAWTTEAADEVAQLETARTSNPKLFNHAGGVVAKGPLDGEGQLRARELASLLEGLAARCRGLVSA